MKLKTNWYITNRSGLNQVLALQYFSSSYLSSSYVFNIFFLKLGVVWTRLWNSSKNFSVYSIWNEFFFVSFRNSRFHNVVSTLTNVFKLDVEKDNVFWTFFNVAHINIEIHKVVSTLIWGCTRYDVIPTKRQRWNNVEMFAGFIPFF